MTARIDMAPSPHDQPDVVVRAIRWWTEQLRSFLPRQSAVEMSAEAVQLDDARLPARLCIVLDRRDAFVASLTLPPGRPETHRNALALRLPDLAPIDPALLEIAAVAVDRHADRRSDYAICMARADRLDALAAEARKRGAQRIAFRPDDCDAVAIFARDERSRRFREGLVHGVLVCLAALLAAVSSILWTSRHEKDLLQISQSERLLRRTAAAVDARVVQTAAADDLVVRQLLDRRAGVVLKTLADASGATPDTSWWTQLVWTPDGLAIRGLSPDAVAAIASMSDAALGWNVALAGPISGASATSAQSYEVRFSRAGEDRE